MRQLAEAFADAIAPALTALGVDLQAYAQRAAPLQYVWRVRKHARELLTVAANMLQPVGGVSHVRVVYPLQALKQRSRGDRRIVGNRDVSTRRRRRAAHLRAAPAGLAGEHGAACHSPPAGGRLDDRDGIRRSS